MTLREFVYRETSEFEVIRTTTGREMTRERFVDLVGKQEKLKKWSENEESTRNREEQVFWIAQRWDWHDNHDWKYVRSRPD
jgi:hypothetical protein